MSNAKGIIFPFLLFIKGKSSVCRMSEKYKIKEFRKKKGLTQLQLAKLVSRDRQVVILHEKGKNLTIPILEKYAEVFGCSVPDLMEESNSHPIDRNLLLECLNAIEQVTVLKNLSTSRQVILEKGLELYDKAIERKLRGEQVEISPFIAELIINQK